MMRTILLAGCAAILSACASEEQQPEQQQESPVATENSAAASPDTVTVSREAAAQLMQERQDNYERIGDAMKLVTQQLRSDSPDLAQVRQGAETIATLAPQVPSWFPAGTGADVGDTAARGEIWQRPDDFQAKAQAFEQAALQFQQAAQGGDVQAIRAAHADLGGTCKACHDLYREKD